MLHQMKLKVQCAAILGGHYWQKLNMIFIIILYNHLIIRNKQTTEGQILLYVEAIDVNKDGRRVFTFSDVTSFGDRFCAAVIRRRSRGIEFTLYLTCTLSF